MASTTVRSLYNQPALASVKEMIYRRLGLPLDSDFFTFEVAADGQTVTIHAKTHATDGTRSPYTGSFTYPLTKLDVGAQLPAELVWSDLYPPTVQALADYLFKTHGYYFEDGEFAVLGDPSHTPLVRGGVLPDTLDEATQTFKLQALPQAVRWTNGSLLTLKLATPNSIAPPGQFGITGNAPDGIVGGAYQFGYATSGGTAPIHFTVTQGTTPFPLDPVSGRMDVTLIDVSEVGDYTWIVTATDATGKTATIRSSMTVRAQELVMTPPTAAPQVTVGVPISIDLGISGGVTPYTLDVTVGELPSTAQFVNGRIVGTFNGLAQAPSTQLPLQVRVTDAQGTQVSRLLSLTITDRNAAAVVASLKTKLASWYPTRTAFANGDVWADACGHTDLVVHGALALVGGSQTRTALNMSQGYAQALAAVHNYTDPFTIVHWHNPTGALSGQHVVSKGADVNGGYAIVTDATSVAFKANLSAQVQSASAGGDLTTGWSMVFTALARNVPSFSINAPIEVDGNPFTGTLLGNAAEPLTLGHHPGQLTGDKYTGLLGDVVFFTDVLWSDERKWFYNNGAGRNFWDLVSVANQQITGSLGAHQVGDVVDFQYGVSGGVGPYVFAISDGALPPGLSMTAGGHITGTITNGGPYSWTIMVTDARNVAVAYADSAQVGYPTLTLSGSFDSGKANTAYSSDLTIAGGNGNYVNPRVTVGSLPAGLSLSVVGNKLRLSGTPTAEFNSSVTVAVSSGDGQSATHAQTLTIIPDIVYPTLTLSGNFAVGTAGQPYSGVITINGGNGLNSNARVTAGTLPAELTLSVVGNSIRLSGNPVNYFNGQVTVAVDSADGQTASSVQAIQVQTQDTAALRRGMRAKITSFWDFNQRATDQGRAGLSFARIDGQAIAYTQINGRYAMAAQHVSAAITTGALGLNAIHGTDSWTFGARLRAAEQGNFCLSVSDAGGGLANELMAIGVNASNQWTAVVRDINKADVVSLAGGSNAVGTFQHVVLKVDGTNAYLMVDGQVVAQAAIPAVALRYTGTLRFTVQNSDTTYHSSADVSEMFFAHAALSQTEVGYLANLGAARAYSDFGNEPYTDASHDAAVTALAPSASYPLNETSGSAAVDNTGTNGNGTYTGATLAAMDAPSGIGGKAPNFPGTGGVTLPSTNLGTGDVTLLGYYRPANWPNYGRLFHLGVTGGQNAAALTLGNNNVAGEMLGTGFDSNGQSMGAPAYPRPLAVTNAWFQASMTYAVASKRLAVMHNGLTATGQILTGAIPTAARTAAYLMTSNANEYGIGGLSRASIFRASVAPSDLCRLRDLALPPLSLAMTTLPSARTTYAYSQDVAINGGNAGLAVSITSGSLPAGVTMSLIGRKLRFAGKPAANAFGNFYPTVTITTVTGETLVQQMSLYVADAAAVLSRLRFNGNNNTTAIADDVSGNAWQVVNNAALSTAQVYEGTASLYCSNGGVRLTGNPLSTVGNGDFTLRGVFYTTTLAGSQMLWKSPVGGTSLYVENGTITWYEGGTLRLTSASFTLNAWHSFRLSRQAGVLRIDVDGVAGTNTFASTVDFTTSNATMAYGYNSVNGVETFTGYLDFFELLSTADDDRIAAIGLVPLHLAGTWSSTMSTLTGYTSTVTPVGGTGTLRNPRVISGALPAGLTQSVSGGSWTLNGLPTMTGAYSFTVAADSGDGQTVYMTVTGTVTQGVPTDAYAQTALSYSPLFYYGSTESNGALLDSSGQSNDALPVDGTAAYRQPPIRPDGVGYAIKLDGTNSFRVPQLVSQQTAGWVSFWAKPSTTSGECMLYSEGVGAGPTFQLKASYLNGGGLTWEADNLDGAWQKQWSGPLDPAVPHHVLVTWDATHKCIYVDGVQVVNLAVNGKATYGADPGQSYIGREQRGLNIYTPPYQGTFQGLCGGSGLLTADQAATLFAAAGGSNSPGITSRFWKINVLQPLNGETYMNLGYIGLRGEPGGVNLAYNNPTGSAAASSTYADAWLPIYAFNRAGGNDAGQSFWHSGYQNSGFWISYDFGEGKAVTLREIAIQSWNVQDRVPGEFDVQVSDDGVTWITVASYKVTSWALNAIKSFSLLKGNALAASLISKTVAWWPLNETGGTILKDVHGGYDLSMHGSNYALAQPSLRVGGPGTLQWTGSSSADTYLVGPVIPGSLQGPKDRSFFTWFKANSLAGQNTPIDLYTGGEDETSNVQLELLIDSSGNLGTLWENGGGDNITTGGPAVGTASHFIGYNMDSSAKKVVYTVDAADSAPVSYSKNPSGGATTQFYMGTVESGNNSSSGYQQDSVIFASQLTIEEKRWLYNGGRGRDYATVKSQAQNGSMIGMALYDALVSWWEFKLSGVDSHGYNPFTNYGSNALDVSNGQLVSGKLGNAFRSPTTPINASVLDVTFTANGSGALAFWYKATVPATPQVIAELGNSNSRGECLFVSTTDAGILAAGIRDGNTNVAANPSMSYALETQNFHFIVVQKTMTTLEFWVDNVLIASVPLSISSVNAYDRFSLGSTYSGYGAAGAVSQPAWFNRSLSPQELTFLWNSGKGLTYAQLVSSGNGATDAYSATVLAKKPVGYWRLNDLGSTAVDLSGNGLHGTYSNAPAQGDVSLLPNGQGRSTRFGSTVGNAFVQLPTSAVLNAVTAPLTIEAWVKASSLATEVIFGGGTASMQLALSADGSSGKPYFGQSGVSNANDSTAALTQGTVAHVVTTVDALGQVSYVVNGVPAGGPFGYTPNFQGTGPATIARYSQSDNYAFKGNLQEVAVYNRALTLAEIQANYVAGGGVVGS